MTQNFLPDGDELSELTADYLSRLQNLPRENIQEQFKNCLVFRVSLYSLREQLFTFLKEGFEEYIKRHGLSRANKKTLKGKIKEKVRSTDPQSKHPIPLRKLPTGCNKETTDRHQRHIRALQEKVDRRIAQITVLKEKEIEATWHAFARCYTWSFADRNSKQGKVEEGDPKDLLEVLKNCSLFKPVLYTAAYAVIGNRNTYYGHLSELLIDSDTLKTLKTATASLIDLISTTDHIDFSD